jgi:NADPH-dependent curcumin reductase CurA
VEVHQLVVGNFGATHQDPFLAEMTDWVRDGLIKYKEDLWPGLEQAPTAFRAMLEGGSFGKTLIGVGEDPRWTKASRRPIG